MLRHQKMTAIIVAILIVAVGLSWFSGCGREKEEEVIKIGAILPLTGSAAKIGDIKQRGMMIAVEEINESGGIQGKKIEMVVEDSKNDAKTGIAAMRKLIAVDKTPVIISAMSGVSVSLTSIANEEKVVLFANAGHPSLSKSGIYVFRNYPSTDVETKPIANFIIDQKIKRLGILVINDDFGQGLKDSLKNYLKGTDTEIVVEEVFEKNGQDFRSLVSKFLTQEPESIYLGGYGTSIALVAKQLREARFKGQILGSSGLLFPDVLNIAKEALEAAIITAPGFDDESSDAYVKNFVDRYEKKFQKKPSQDEAMEYDSIKLIAEAIKQGGYSAEGIRKSLALIKNFKGAIGELEILPTRDVAIPIVLKTIQHGEITNFTYPPK